MVSIFKNLNVWKIMKFVLWVKFYLIPTSRPLHFRVGWRGVRYYKMCKVLHLLWTSAILKNLKILICIQNFENFCSVDKHYRARLYYILGSKSLWNLEFFHCLTKKFIVIYNKDCVKKCVLHICRVPRHSLEGHTQK